MSPSLFFSHFLQIMWSCVHSCFDWACPTSSSHHMRMSQRNDSHAACVVRQPWANWIKIVWQLSKIKPREGRENHFYFILFLQVFFSASAWCSALAAADDVQDFCSQYRGGESNLPCSVNKLYKFSRRCVISKNESERIFLSLWFRQMWLIDWLTDSAHKKCK